MDGVLEWNVVIGQAYIINGVVVRFAESTSKRARIMMARPGGAIEFRQAHPEEKALTYPKVVD